MAGFSFIEVPDRDAKKVMKALDGTFYKGRQVRCNEDGSKPSDAPSDARRGRRSEGRDAARGGRGDRKDSSRGGRRGEERRDNGDFSRFEKKSKRGQYRDFDADVAGMPETGDWRQFFKGGNDQSRRRGKKEDLRSEMPDFAEEGWARRRPKKK